MESLLDPMCRLVGINPDKAEAWLSLPFEKNQPSRLAAPDTIHSQQLSRIEMEIVLPIPGLIWFKAFKRGEMNRCIRWKLCFRHRAPGEQSSIVIGQSDAVVGKKSETGLRQRQRQGRFAGSRISRKQQATSHPGDTSTMQSAQPHGRSCNRENDREYRSLPKIRVAGPVGCETTQTRSRGKVD